MNVNLRVVHTLKKKKKIVSSCYDMTLLLFLLIQSLILLHKPHL